MNGVHTIFDTRRTHGDDSLPETAMRAKELDTAAVPKRSTAAKGHASSFLAERGEFGSSLGRMKKEL
jgi:hypothetical protein